MNFQEYDQTIQKWVEAVEENFGNNAEATFQYCNDIIEYANKNQDQKLLGFANFYFGQTYYCLNDLAGFIDCTSKAVNHFIAIGEWEYRSRCYNCLGIISSNRGNMPVAQDYYMHALECCRNYPNSKLQECAVDINMGSMNLQIQRFLEAEECLNHAMELIQGMPKAAEYHPFSVSILVNLIKCYLFQKKYDMMLRLFDV